MRLLFNFILFFCCLFSFSSIAQEVKKGPRPAKVISFSIGQPLKLEKRTTDPSVPKNENLQTGRDIEVGIGFRKNRLSSHKYGYAVDYRYLSMRAISLPADFSGASTLFGNMKPLSDYQHSLGFRWTYPKRIIQNVLWVPELGPSVHLVGLVEFTPNYFASGGNYDQKIDFSFTPGIQLFNRLSFLAGKSFALDLFVNANLNLKFSYTSLGIQMNFGRTNKE